MYFKGPSFKEISWHLRMQTSPMTDLVLCYLILIEIKPLENVLEIRLLVALYLFSAHSMSKRLIDTPI